MIVAGLVALAVADLSTAPWGTQKIPELPGCYAALLARRPGASFCEVHGGNGWDYLRYQSTLAYWQSLHGGRTSAGNPGVTNRRLQNRILDGSPFRHDRIEDPAYLVGSGPWAFGLVHDARFEDYAWLYLTANDFDYLILHKWTWDGRPAPPALARTRERLAGAIVFEDERTVAIDRRRLAAPRQPVLICADGWRDQIVRRGRSEAIVSEDAELIVYNPSPDRPLRLRVHASSYLRPRTVRLVTDRGELASWRVSPTEESWLLSPRVRLPNGLQVIALRSDGAERPRKPKYAPVEGDMTPFSLWVSAVQIVGEESLAGKPEARRR